MNDLLVAQCPNCLTRFRLSQDHLQAAAGNVRCGACLKVFNASAQIDTASDVPVAPASSVAAQERQQPAAAESALDRQGTLLIHDNLELDDLDLEALGLDKSILEEINPEAKTASTGAEDLNDNMQPMSPRASAEIEADAPCPDEQAYTCTADDPIVDASYAGEEPSSERSSEPSLDPHPADAPEQASVVEPLGVTPQNSLRSTDARIDSALQFDSVPEKLDTWDIQLDLDKDLGNSSTCPAGTPDELDDAELHEAFREAASSRDFAPRTVPPEPPPTVDSKQNVFGMVIPPAMRPMTASSPDQVGFLREQRPAFSDVEPAAQRQRKFAEEHPGFRERQQQGRHEPSPAGLESNLSLPELVDEPLYLDDLPRARKPRLQWLWASLSAAAAVALLGQIATYNYAALAHNERTRPTLEQLCFLAGCELPARVNIDLIRSSNLIVRPHKDFPNALAIDVILYNRADFAQPFPVLRMTFSDLAGLEISSKSFRPAEYLGGELAGTTLMPPQTPVHVGLSMLDPGSKVASYNLDFLSP